jgi:hypothetical protein
MREYKIIDTIRLKVNIQNGHTVSVVNAHAIAHEFFASSMKAEVATCNSK